MPADTGADPALAASRADAARVVQLILDQLPPSYGDALEWKYVEGLGVKEIAVRLDVTPLAAESLLARARRAFKDAWRTMMGDSLRDIPGAAGI
jgi:RNA polymerase sigma-70 factor (ECF subfamily)